MKKLRKPADSETGGGGMGSMWFYRTSRVKGGEFHSQGNYENGKIKRQNAMAL